MTAMSAKQLLAATCPHGTELGKCLDLWCASRVEDLLHGDYAANLPELPEEVKMHGTQP
jgi:hypothetical protein